MQKHSPTPWKIIAFDDGTQDVYAADGRHLFAWSVVKAREVCDLALIVDAVNDHERLRDTIRSYGETIVQLNEAAQRSELEAIRLRDLVKRLAHAVEVLISPFDAPAHNAKALIREAREAIGENKP